MTPEECAASCETAYRTLLKTWNYKVIDDELSIVIRSQMQDFIQRCVDDQNAKLKAKIKELEQNYQQFLQKHRHALGVLGTVAIERDELQRKLNAVVNIVKSNERIKYHSDNSFDDGYNGAIENVLSGIKTIMEAKPEASEEATLHGGDV